MSHARRLLVDRLDPTAARDAWRAWAGSRLLVLAAAAIGAVLFPFGPTAQTASPVFTEPFGSWPLGDLLDFLLGPFIRWDAIWYVQIAHDGYTPDHLSGVTVDARPAFFPVYPMLARLLGGFAGVGAAVVVACAISLVALLATLYLLHRLVTLELGSSAARASVMLLAFSPVAYFLSAPYTESLFLLETVGAFYAARRGRWAVAGALGALASATRGVGVMLLVGLLLLYLYEDRRIGALAADVRRGIGRLGPRRRPGASILWLGLAPLGLVAYSVYLRAEVGDAQAWRHREGFFGRPDLVNPLEGIRRGTEAAFDALRGTAPDDLQFSIVFAWCVLVFALVALVGVFRTLPVAYGVYSLALLVPALCAPYVDAPLANLPRYYLVAFPLYVWLGYACERRGMTDRVVLGFAASLSVLTAGFATWQHVG